MRIVIYTFFALTAFAANSVLCRMALGEKTIDPSSFTIIRLFSGTIILLFIMKIKYRVKTKITKMRWLSSGMLFIYAVSFSFAYMTLSTGTGALVLFGSVQTALILISIYSGYRPHLSEWIGLLIAFSGFIFLVLPNISTPSFVGFILMSIAGFAWGVYSWLGIASKNPITETALNFTAALPFVIILMIFAIPYLQASAKGIILAIISGSAASGIGYILWYSALRGMSATESAVVQLFVPIIAAFGGVIFISETITARLLIASILILGGILTVVLGRYCFIKSKPAQLTN